MRRRLLAQKGAALVIAVVAVGGSAVLVEASASGSKDPASWIHTFRGQMDSVTGQQQQGDVREDHDATGARTNDKDHKATGGKTNHKDHEATGARNNHDTDRDDPKSEEKADHTARPEPAGKVDDDKTKAAREQDQEKDDDGEDVGSGEYGDKGKSHEQPKPGGKPKPSDKGKKSDNEHEKD